MDIVLCILAPAPKQPVCRCYRLIYMEHCMSPEASTAESARFLRNASRSNSPGGSARSNSLIRESQPQGNPRTLASRSARPEAPTGQITWLAHP